MLFIYFQKIQNSADTQIWNVLAEVFLKKRFTFHTGFQISLRPLFGLIGSAKKIFRLVRSGYVLVHLSPNGLQLHFHFLCVLISLESVLMDKSLSHYMPSYVQSSFTFLLPGILLHFMFSTFNCCILQSSTPNKTINKDFRLFWASIFDA